MRLLSIIIFSIPYFVCLGQQKQVCFSLDDLPVVNHEITDSTYQKNLFNKIIHSLESNNVPAIGFVNERKLYTNGVIIKYQVDLLRNWAARGLELGNHTFSHPDYNTVSFDFYTDNIMKGEIIVKKILSEQHKQIKYFRHPFLHVGNTKAKADSLSEFLSSHHYLAAPVTIDNDDYLFALAYSRAKAKNDAALMNTIGHDYITYMEKKLNYYEKQSTYLFGRNIRQILLLHTSLLNADYLDALIALYRAHNYSFVSMDNALDDPAYKTEITVFGKWGISWIDKWALSGGKKELLQEDPTTPDYIRKMAE